MTAVSMPASDAAPDGDVVAHLAGTRLFSLLSPEELTALAPLFSAVRYAPGQLVSRQGEVDATLWVVAEGGVTLHRRTATGALVHVGYRGYGGTVGEYGIFTGQPRETSARALQPTLLLYTDRESLWTLLSRNADLMDRLVLEDGLRERMRLPTPSPAPTGERPVAQYRHHWTTLARSLAVPVALIGASMAAAGVGATYAGTPARVIALALVGLGLPLLVFAWACLNWWFDVLILTTHRVVHVDRTPGIASRRVEAPLHRIEDVTVVVPHLFARIMDYGSVVVMTAGARAGIRFDAVRRPQAIRDAIFTQAEIAAATAKRERQEWIARRISEAVAVPESVADMPGVGESHPDSAREEHAPGLGARVVREVQSLLPRMRLQSADGTVTWRKHWWVLVRHVGLVCLALLAVAAGMVRTAVVGSPVPMPVWWSAAAILGAWLLYGYEDWRNDKYVLTDDHLIDVERRPFGLYKELRQARLGRIQDIRYTVPHPWAVLLNYGDVHIQTAADAGRFTFDRVHNPAAVQEEIVSRMNGLRDRQEAAAEVRQADEMVRWFAAYHRLGAAASPANPSPNAIVTGSAASPEAP